jgi:hypothetical protein
MLAIESAIRESLSAMQPDVGASAKAGAKGELSFDRIGSNREVERQVVVLRSSAATLVARTDRTHWTGTARAPGALPVAPRIPDLARGHLEHQTIAGLPRVQQIVFNALGRQLNAA